LSTRIRTRRNIFTLLDCKLSTIRNLFLLEAAFIGFLGGIIGCALSYLVSALINSYATGSAMDMTGAGAGVLFDISVIPPWLTAAALVFATLISMVSGIIPALRAMRLSPLEALRTG
jgi:ABC-type lipoprotein release transport system permease subunit